jgi:hypothetical protein
MARKESKAFTESVNGTVQTARTMSGAPLDFLRCIAMGPREPLAIPDSDSSPASVLDKTGSSSLGIAAFGDTVCTGFHDEDEEPNNARRLFSPALRAAV